MGKSNYMFRTYLKVVEGDKIRAGREQNDHDSFSHQYIQIVHCIQRYVLQIVTRHIHHEHLPDLLQRQYEMPTPDDGTLFQNIYDDTSKYFFEETLTEEEFTKFFFDHLHEEYSIGDIGILQERVATVTNGFDKENSLRAIFGKLLSGTIKLFVEDGPVEKKEDEKHNLGLAMYDLTCFKSDLST